MAQTSMPKSAQLHMGHFRQRIVGEDFEMMSWLGLTCYPRRKRAILFRREKLVASSSQRLGHFPVILKLAGPGELRCMLYVPKMAPSHNPWVSAVRSIRLPLETKAIKRTAMPFLGMNTEREA